MLIRSRNNGRRPGLVVLCAIASLLPTFLGSTTARASETYGHATSICSLSDNRIGEASGLTASQINDGVLYAHNDSGDRPRFFAISASCETLATYRINGAVAFDWEDAASAPGFDGRPSLYFGDIGDNLTVRDTVRVIEVPEPNIDDDVAGKTSIARDDTDSSANAFVVDPTATYQLRYPDGRHNAEALAVTNSHEILVITKDADGIAGLYATSSELKPTEVNELRRVAVFGLPPQSRTSPKPTARELQITGAALSPDDELLAVRTTDTVWYWSIDRNDTDQSVVDAIGRAVATTPTELEFPQQSQAEAVTFSADGRAILTTSEGSDAKVYARVGATKHPRPVYSPAQSPSSTTSTVPTSQAPTTSSSSSVSSSQANPMVIAWPEVIRGIVAVVLAIGAIVLILTFRRRHRSRNASE